MKVFSRATVLGTIAAVLTLCGCVVRGPYTYDHGDRIDRFGHHDVHWCDHHRRDPYCHR
jgi:hypothetical protein